MATERFPDSFVAEDPQKALEALNEVLHGEDNAEWFCQRACAHTLLENYSCAVEDAKKAQQLQPNLPRAFLRRGIAEFHLNNHESAHAAFARGRQLDVSDECFEGWLKRCEDKMGVSSEPTPIGSNGKTPAGPVVKRDWYQTESHVIVTVMSKNTPKDGVSASFTGRELAATVRLRCSVVAMTTKDSRTLCFLA
ncbi:protein SGT1 homolog [Brachionichthys hirsutus]|uniref:protein SGT1 homolog n=1 Tax=Brachionichthys hirsutus TaxID=412623 RepID=UPI0036051F8C